MALRQSANPRQVQDARRDARILWQRRQFLVQSAEGRQITFVIGPLNGRNDRERSLLGGVLATVMVGGRCLCQ